MFILLVGKWGKAGVIYSHYHNEHLCGYKKSFNKQTLQEGTERGARIYKDGFTYEVYLGCLWKSEQGGLNVVAV